MIDFCNAHIPSGMCRSVERENAHQNQHPVRDASLTGCGGSTSRHFLPSDAFLTECKNSYKLFIPSYMRKLLIILLLATPVGLFGQQKPTPEIVEQQSYDLYMLGSWSDLIALQSEAQKQNIDSKYLRQRTGYACFMMKDYLSAQIQYEKAYQFDKTDPITLEYLYYCGVYRGDYVYAQCWAGRMPEELQQKLDVMEIMPFDAIDLEYNYKAVDATTRSDASYYRIGLNLRFSHTVTMYNSYSGYAQKVDGDKVSQPEYYGIMTVSILPRLRLRAGYHGLFASVGDYKATSNMGIVAIYGEPGRWSLGASGFVMENTSQYNFSAGYRFKGHNDIYVNSIFTGLSNAGTVRPVYTQNAGVKIYRSLWNESFVTFGTLNNYATLDGLYVYNSLDPTRFRAGTTFFWLPVPKLMFTLNYTYDKKEIADNGSKYNLHSVSLGLKWKI